MNNSLQKGFARSCRLFVGLPIVFLTLAGAAAAPAHALHMTVMRDAPTVDGVVRTDEYAASHGVMFSIDTNFGDYEKNFLSPRPVKTFYVWNERNLHIALNDTDATVTKTVRFDPSALGIASGVGRELFSGAAFDFAGSDGSHRVTVTLPSRESLFIDFD